MQKNANQPIDLNWLCCWRAEDLAPILSPQSIGAMGISTKVLPPSTATSAQQLRYRHHELDRLGRPANSERWG